LKKANHATDRQAISHFAQIINIGPAFEKDFEILGLSTPQELIDEDPHKLYQGLCQKTGVRQDPCVLDVLMSAVDYMNGNPPQPWWNYTAARKEKWGQLNS